MEICKNGALREDYEVIERATGKRVRVVFVTSVRQAITYHLKSRRKPCHDGNLNKFAARSLASDMERLQFLASQPADKQRAYYRHYKLVPKTF